VSATHLWRTTSACLLLYSICCCDAALMGSIKILQMDREGVEDRVYRLHYNDSQKRTDTFSLVRHTPSEQLPSGWTAVQLTVLVSGRLKKCPCIQGAFLQQMRVTACQGLPQSHHAGGVP
jgi:hypothetical protein